MNRRNFFASATSAAAAASALGANDRIRIGLIGAGNRGSYVAGIAAKEPNVEIAAACDVYEPRREAAAARYGAQCVLTGDYREVLGRKDLDAVIVGSPDHWHVPIAIAALDAGMHVYCEKPVTHIVEEGTPLIAAVERSGRAFASGLQQRAWPHYLDAKKEVDAGKLGRVYFAQAYWYFKMPQHGFVSGDNRPTVDKAKLDWKGFLGPAPDQGFEPHKFLSWRSYWDFGGGGFDDFMTHWIDVVQWFIGSPEPFAVEAAGVWEEARRGDIPASMTAMMQYPGNQLVTYDGSYVAANHESGILFRGTEATMMLTRDGYTISPKGSPLLSHKMHTQTASEVVSKQDGTIDNVRNWLECARSGGTPLSNVRAAVAAAQTSHLANRAALEKRMVGTGAAVSVAAPAGFTPVFNGRDLTGWHISQVNHHGATKSWNVERGFIMGTQEPANVGGILLTDRRYRNFEVIAEINPDWGCDGGLFLRSTEKGEAYQVMLDYLSGGNIGGIYGEALENVKGQPSTSWQNYWKRGQWNEVRARIEGDAPHIQVWLNGTKITDFQDTANHLPGGASDGMIAVQVHLGNRWVPGGWHRFRRIEVKEI